MAVLRQHGRRPGGLFLSMVWLAATGLHAGQLAGNGIEPEISFRDAEMARVAGRTDEAVRLYREALTRHPRSQEGWQKLGTLLADRQDYPAAQEAFRRLLDISPESGDGWVLLGLAEFHLAQYAQALQHLEQARAFRIADPSLLRLLYYHTALIMNLLGDFDTAQKRLLLLYREGVRSEELTEALGLAALRIRALPGREPADIQPAVKDVGRQLMLGFGQPVEIAREGFRNLLERYPTTPGVHYAYGNYLAAHSRYEEAREAYEQELRNSVDHVMARLQIALLKTQHFNQPQEALALARAAVKLEPDSFAPHWVLGRILLKLNEADAAIRELEVAAKLAPDSVPIHHTLLNAYNKAKRKEDAARVEEILQRLQAFEAAHKPRAKPAGIKVGEPENPAPSLPP